LILLIDIQFINLIYVFVVWVRFYGFIGGFLSFFWLGAVVFVRSLNMLLRYTIWPINKIKFLLSILILYTGSVFLLFVFRAEMRRFLGLEIGRFRTRYRWFFGALYWLGYAPFCVGEWVRDVSKKVLKKVSEKAPEKRQKNESKGRWKMSRKWCLGRGERTGLWGAKRQRKGYA